MGSTIRTGNNTQEYVLGTSEEELLRLGYQHRVWSRDAFAAWERAGFMPGQTIVDVGCGPGYATMDLAQLVGPSGRVIAVDQAPGFIEHLDHRARALGLRQIETRVCDIERTEVFATGADGAYARWVLCFVGNPETVVAAVGRSLRPGGVFAVQDYYDYTGIQLAPASDVFRRAIEAVDRSWRERGGDPDVGCRLPGMMERCGFEVRAVRPLVRVARPQSSLWEWPARFFRNYLPALVEMGYLSAETRAEFERDWEEHSKDPGAFFATPPMVEVIGVKRADGAGTEHRLRS
jgi:SAM-dependent methyltransferase